MKDDIDIDMNSAESVQKGIHFHQFRVLTAFLFYPVSLWIFYYIWQELCKATPSLKTFENNFLFIILLIYILGNPLIHILFRLVKIIRLKNHLEKLQKKNFTHNRTMNIAKMHSSGIRGIRKKSSFLNYIKERYPELFVDVVMADPDTMKSKSLSLRILGFMVMICGLFMLGVLYSEMQIAFDKDVFILCLLSILFILGGGYLAILEPRKLKKDVDDLKKKDKMYFHSDLK